MGHSLGQPFLAATSLKEGGKAASPLIVYRTIYRRKDLRR